MNEAFVFFPKHFQGQPERLINDVQISGAHFLFPLTAFMIHTLAAAVLLFFCHSPGEIARKGKSPLCLSQTRGKRRKANEELTEHNPSSNKCLLWVFCLHGVDVSKPSLTSSSFSLMIVCCFNCHNCIGIQ